MKGIKVESGSNLKVGGEDSKRVQIVKDGKKRKLVFKDTLLSDAGDITVKTIMDESNAKLSVARKLLFSTDFE